MFQVIQSLRAAYRKEVDDWNKKTEQYLNVALAKPLRHYLVCYLENNISSVFYKFSKEFECKTVIIVFYLCWKILKSVQWSTLYSMIVYHMIKTKKRSKWQNQWQSGSVKVEGRNEPSFSTRSGNNVTYACAKFKQQLHYAKPGVGYLLRWGGISKMWCYFSFCLVAYIK